MVLVPSRIAGSKRQSGNCPLPGTLRAQAEADFRKLESEFNKAKVGDNPEKHSLNLQSASGRIPLGRISWTLTTEC